VNSGRKKENRKQGQEMTHYTIRGLGKKMLESAYRELYWFLDQEFVWGAQGGLRSKGEKSVPSVGNRRRKNCGLTAALKK